MADQTLHDFVLTLLTDAGARSAFLADPETALAAAGLPDVTAQDVQEVVPLVLDYAPVDGLGSLEPDLTSLPTAPDAIEQLQALAGVAGSEPLDAKAVPEVSAGTLAGFASSGGDWLAPGAQPGGTTLDGYLTGVPAAPAIDVPAAVPEPVVPEPAPLPEPLEPPAELPQLPSDVPTPNELPADVPDLPVKLPVDLPELPVLNPLPDSGDAPSLPGNPLGDVIDKSPLGGLLPDKPGLPDLGDTLGGLLH
ncbi:IniB N-terminal domain-containing protein [Amycolatopsis suaedae]|uniref:Uncharacterized protein n=1 Tax=Amycolatopsis suaedae TaxID=2510978 RepID=A0A4Q7IZI1_9PSEU|nr:IniB N-terminal domain-containing protein [Amycolatopsis suaedae]RZQ60461.1 hypothetical protein EWH70_29655 [Amycolatopsis suaedae]